MNRREFLSRSAVYLSATAVATLPFPSAFVKADSEIGQWFEFMQPMMGTYVSVALVAKDFSTARLISGRCFDYMRTIVGQISDWDVTSAIGRLNQNRRANIEQLEGEPARILKDALSVSGRTSGLFDPICRRLTEVWRDAKGAGVVPSRRDVLSALKDSSVATIQVSEGEVSLLGNAMVDVGGIGKGFVAERAANFLKQLGIKFARIACSGDLKYIGPTNWDCAIKDPRGEGELRTLRLFGEIAVSTSGDYENAWTVGDRRYHHLIDPRTGYPGGVNRQVTVIYRSASIADALATALFFVPVEEMKVLLRYFPGAHAIAVNNQGQIQEIGDRML